MTLVRIVYWRDIPVVVTARAGADEITVPLSPRFQELVDVAAQRAGLTEADAYLAEWRTGPEEPHPEPPEAAARAIAAGLEARFPLIRAQALS